MPEPITVDFLFDGDSEARASEQWDALRSRSDETDDVEASGELGDDWLLSLFRWGPLSGSMLQPFAGNDGPERWTVPDVPHVELRYDVGAYRETAPADAELTAEDVTESLVDLVTFLYSASDSTPQFAYGVTDLHKELLAADELPPPVTAESLAENRIEYSTWLTIFPPATVETYGRETLLSAPAWRTETLEEGSVLVVSTPSPLGDGETTAIDEHLGIDPPAAVREHTY